VNRTLRSVTPLPVKKATVEERRVEILDMTRQVLIERGFASTRISDVAKGLGVSTSLIHYHFDSKEQLLAEAFSYAANEDVAEMVAEIEAAPTAVGQLDALIRNYVPEGSHDVEWMLWIDAWGEALRNPLLRAISQELDVQSIELIERVLRAGVSTGEFTCPDPEGAAMRLAGLIDGLGVQFAAHENVLDRDRLLQHVRIVAAAEVGLTVSDFGDAVDQIPVGVIDPVPSVETELQLRRLIDATCDAVLRRDGADLASFWVVDGDWDRGDGVHHVGRQAIERACEEMLDGLSWIVCTAPHAVFTMDGTHTASGRVIVEERFATAQGVTGSRLGTAHDRYVRESGGHWHVVSRRVEIIQLS
jgi:AcrR family transcriptional regulator